MIISYRWLSDYVRLEAAADGTPPIDELVHRLLMSGLNHEATWGVGSDTAIEIEVTSNRPDCLGHIGVARETALLFARPLHLPDPRPAEGPAAVGVAVAIETPEICPFYSARVIRGVRVGPSPAWLVDRLATVGVESVNNVVDVTNFVMLECGQPLHAFDLAKIRGSTISIRRAQNGERFQAINHREYLLNDSMGVIADASGPVALAGVMGGAESEIGPETVDVLLESAQFAPLVVRAAARGLALPSASSYRFERGPDPAAVEWASRRAAALILDMAGGVLEQGAATAGALACAPASIELRSRRVAEVLGVDVPQERQRLILVGLGCVAEAAPTDRVRWLAPTWRRDITREIDLVEEIARIQGYDSVPEGHAISVRPVEPSARERTLRTATAVLVSAGMCEAMTRSVVSEALEATKSPWSTAACLVVSPALVRGADRLRRTLLPSLLEARGGNMAVGAPHGDLFEVAHAYLARVAGGPAGHEHSPAEEPLLLGLVMGGDFSAAKGRAEAVLRRLRVGWNQSGPAASSLLYRPVTLDIFASGRGAEIVLHRPERVLERVGVVGEFAPAALQRFDLAGPVSGMEMRLDRLEFAVAAEPKVRRPSDYPAVQRDLNLVVDQAVPWGEIAAAVREAAGELLEDCRLVQVWEDAERLGADRKSFVIALRLRSDTGTLSSDATRGVVEQIVAACSARCGAALRG